MIVRIMAEGQYAVAADDFARLQAMDDLLLDAVHQGAEHRFHELFQSAVALVRSGQPIHEMVPSDLILPPADTDLQAARQLLESHGLIDQD